MREKYFKWLCNYISDTEDHKRGYRMLLATLFERDFEWAIEMDKDRADDGLDLRVRFADENEVSLEDDLYPLDGPCSMLEMMVALALRCDETIMYDPVHGDRTAIWFWDMITSSGLYVYDDMSFDMEEVDGILERILDRTYRRDGKGGLFTIEGITSDLRDVTIWYQMLWYLDSIL